MNKRLLFSGFALFFLFVHSVGAQSNEGVSEKKDSLSYRSIMVIPFDPDLYFNDSDNELAAANKKSIPEVRSMLRYGLGGNVRGMVANHYSTRYLLTDTAKTAYDDLLRIYGAISYRKEKPFESLARDKVEDNTPKNPIEKVFGKKTNNGKTEEKGQTNSRYENVPEENRRYMNVVIKNPAMLEELHQTYGTELFLFINQFEMVTNYQLCLDRANNIFERKVKVHFSIYDRTGKQLAGDIVVVRFDTQTSDLVKIISQNFPLVSAYIAERLPSAKKVKSPKEGQPAKEGEGQPELEYIDWSEQN